MDNVKAFLVIDESSLSQEHKDFLKNHIQHISEFADIMSQHNDFIQKINNIDATFYSRKEELMNKYQTLIIMIDRIKSLLNDSICQNCGQISADKLRNLANYILEITYEDINNSTNAS